MKLSNITYFQDHLSLILQPITGRQGVSYRYMILLALYVKFPKK